MHSFSTNFKFYDKKHKINSFQSLFFSIYVYIFIYIYIYIYIYVYIYIYIMYILLLVLSNTYNLYIYICPVGVTSLYRVLNYRAINK